MKLPGPTASEILIAYFASNRTETLESSAAAVKFDMAEGTAEMALRRLRDRWFLELEAAGKRGIGGARAVYRVGPVLLKLIGHEVEP